MSDRKQLLGLGWVEERLEEGTVVPVSHNFTFCSTLPHSQSQCSDTLIPEINNSEDLNWAPF